MRVLVLGGTRFIGRAVVLELYRMGHDVTVFHRGVVEDEELLAVRHIHGDRRHLATFSSTFEQLAPDVVLDMRAMTEQDAQSVMQTLAGIARRVVVVSSMDVYRAYGRLKRIEPGPPDAVPLAENAPLRESRYPDRDAGEFARDFDNILVERVMMGEPTLPGTVVRLPFVYGPHDYQHRLHYFLKRMDDRRPAIVLDDTTARWRSSWGYVENVAVAIALAVTDDRATGRVYNVADEPPVSEAEWVGAIGSAAGWSGDIVILPRDRVPAHLLHWGESDLEQSLVADTTRIRHELGYSERVPRNEALTLSIAWERAHPLQEVDPALFDYPAEDALLTLPR